MNHQGKVATREARARTLAAACVRRARSSVAMTQEGLGRALGSAGRCVRRAESGRSDLGHLEVALRCPEYARALALELLEIADRESRLPKLPQNRGSHVALAGTRGTAPEQVHRLESAVPEQEHESAAPSGERLAA